MLKTLSSYINSYNTFLNVAVSCSGNGTQANKRSIDHSLQNPTNLITLSDTEQYTKALGVEWNTTHDYFRLTPIRELLPSGDLTKRRFVSDIAKVFNVFGWFAPTTIKMKILLQRLWELKIDWDDPVPPSIQEIWSKW